MPVFQAFIGVFISLRFYQFQVLFSKRFHGGFFNKKEKEERGRNSAVSRRKQPSGNHRAGDARLGAGRIKETKR